MSIAQSIIGEYDHEMKTTRSLLEGIPDGKFNWKPHDKSMSLGQLSSHIVTLSGWGVAIMKQTEFNLKPTEGAPTQPPAAETRSALLEKFDADTASVREAISGASDADFMVEWSLKSGDQTFFAMPRVAVLRTFMTNHLIHHRGQLSVYLRLLDVPLPSIYGPTADSPWQG